MEITIRRIETESLEDKGIFEALFREYLSGFTVELDLSVIAQLFALPYFHGFISLSMISLPVLWFALNRSQLIVRKE
ncbi:hypothetical protein NB478_14120 [Vibrio antiquarius]|nr:hypothetical protein [Vibrio antiquarius]MCR9366064.1 hypothetical protein [Vibrio antiquarius]